MTDSVVSGSDLNPQGANLITEKMDPSLPKKGTFLDKAMIALWLFFFVFCIDSSSLFSNCEMMQYYPVPLT